MSKRNHKWLMGLVFMLVGFLVLAVSSMDYEEEQYKLDFYCKMVTIYKESDPAANMGWPDYKGVYDTACAKP